MSDETLQQQGWREKLEDEYEEMVYAISHDLRQPIVGIMGYAAMLQEDLANIDPQLGHFAERILANTKRLDQILTSFLELSRAGRHPDPKSRVDVGRLLDEVRMRTSDVLEAREAQIIRRPELPGLVRGAHADVFQVFRQLVSNAAEFASPDRAPIIEIGSEGPLPDDAGMVHLWVRDNGIGIPAAYLEEIFRVCRTLSTEVPKRKGLGLAMVRKLTDRYGGNAWAESVEGEGSTFHFTWPV